MNSTQQHDASNDSECHQSKESDLIFVHKTLSKSTCPGRCKGRVFLEALATNRSALAGGASYFAGNMRGKFVTHCNLQDFWAQTASPSFLSQNFVAKIVTNKMSILGLVWQYFAIFTPSWVRMSGGKNASKNDSFLHWGARAENMSKIASKTSCILDFRLVKVLTANTIVHGWFALRAGSNKCEWNTGIYNTFQPPRRKNHRKKYCFLRIG